MTEAGRVTDGGELIRADFGARRVVGRAGEGLLSKKQLAAHLGCSTSTIDRYCKAGMPFTVNKVSGRRGFRASACEEWLYDSP